MLKAYKNVPPGIDALHQCGGRRSFTWYKASVRALLSGTAVLWRLFSDSTESNADASAWSSAH